MSWVVVSASCPLCIHVKCALPTLQTRGFKIIALDEPMSPSVSDLAWALQVTSLPAIQHDGVLHCGNDALHWLINEHFVDNVDVNTHGTTISELKTLQLLIHNKENTNAISQDSNKMLQLIRSWA